MIQTSVVRSRFRKLALVIALAPMAAAVVQRLPRDASAATPTDAERDGRNKVPPPSPCNLQLSATTNRCLGMLDVKKLLDPNTTADDRWNIVYPVRNDITEDESENRKLYDNSKSCRKKKSQRATAWYNDDSRRFDIRLLKKNEGVLMGAMKFLDNCPGDYYYKNAGDMLDKDDLNRRLLVIAWHDETVQDVKTRYQLFQVLGDEGHRKLAPFGTSHPVGYCVHEGKDTDTPAADFDNCDAVMRAGRISTEFRVDMPVVRSLARCDPELSDGCIKDAEVKARVRDFRGVAADHKQAFTKALVALTRVQHPETDPFWFTCGAGCCTATMQ